MAKRLSSVLGIDIGSRKIKVAEVRTQAKEPVISALGMIDTPEGAVDHTGVYNAEAVGVALKQALSQAGASVSHVVVSIAGQASVLVRTLEVPRMSPAELSEHMQWEINRNIPFAESNVLSDYKQLEDEDPSSANMEVVMAISPQSAIDTVVACIKKAGKQMAAIDVQALGIARSLKVSYADLYQDLTVCVVDVGHLTTSINIYKNGRLLMPRQVPVGGEMFTKAIADAMGVGMEEAELLKQQKCHVHVGLLQTAIPDSFSFGVPDAGTGAAPGLTQEFQPYNPFADDMPSAGPATPPEALPPAPAADEPFHTGAFEEPTTFGETQPPAAAEAEPPSAYDPFSAASAPAPEPAHAADMPTPIVPGDPETQRINNSVAPVLEEFVAEVRRSLDYFRSRSGNVDHLVLSGGASKLAGLTETLGQALAVACDSYDPMRHISVSGKKIEPTFVDENRPDFAIAVGNGLHIFFE
ncbi:MAG TPA: type IV pilus assembly protein PilM [Fimbriimonadaceae bacterium]|jgi:type IV pilus assembly protein PilM